ncbi:MAG: protein kinase [Scytonema hyalinum WJT4-NPBG1]|jgi:serine/threonine-protein kinase|nr:protein kinase [Scytonema hyalinum WJT4-NPBG1]
MNVPKQPGVKGYWQPGHQLYQGKYTIEKDLGCGGFGVTYLARDRKFQQVVVKTLNEDVQHHPQFEKLRQDFLNEAIRLAKCSHHPHIVKIIELFEEEGLPCIVMEYVPGKDLAAWVEQRTLGESEAIYYIRQIGEALDAIHRQGFLHRDVKPSNIMIADDGSRAVLIDFGIAREYQQGGLTTQIAFISEGYSPIEQHYPTEKQTPYTDVYALAATLYFALTGKKPQKSQLRHYNLAQYQTDCLIAPKQINPDISERVNTAILQGMAVKPEARPQTIKAWLDLLPDTKLIPTKNLKNYFSSRTIPQLTMPVNSSSHGISTSQKRRFYFPLWGVYLTFLLIISSVSYSIISSKIYTKYLSSIFINEENLLYKNYDDSFQLKYPQTWRLTQHQSHDFTQTVAELLAPPNSDASNGALGKIIVEIRDLGNAPALTKVKQETIKHIKQWVANSEILENSETSLAGRQAYLLVYQGIDNGRGIRRMRVATVKNNREYALTYEADLSHYDLQKQSAQKIIDSFDWLNPQ